MTQPLQNLPKHERYRHAYSRFGFYWGLGIEHETYIMTNHVKKIKTFENQMKPERYCVSYYRAYLQEPLIMALACTCKDAGEYLTLPILMNGHSLTQCDVNGEHATTYERVPKPNPKYAGQSLFDWACIYSTWLRAEVGRIFMWDGDTVEFMTQRFYRATIASVMSELKEGEARFVQELQQLPKQGIIAGYGPLTLACPRNEPFATFVTNKANVSMFNNGTIHINVTLPTRLGFNKTPFWPRDFLEKHRRLARLVQWLEPLWIAVHGSGDPLASGIYDGYFAKGSQRLAVSRYIGVGTFDTTTMPVGKILQVAKADVGSVPWYRTDTAYAPLDVIGLDINYNKHWAHGLELRFLDQLPFESLESVMQQVVILMDMANEPGIKVPDPRTSPLWISAARSAIYDGPDWSVAPEELNALCGALGIAAETKEPLCPSQALAWIFSGLEDRKAYCWKNMVVKPYRNSWWSRFMCC